MLVAVDQWRGIPGVALRPVTKTAQVKGARSQCHPGQVETGASGSRAEIIRDVWEVDKSHAGAYLGLLLTLAEGLGDVLYPLRS